MDLWEEEFYTARNPRAVAVNGCVSVREDGGVGVRWSAEGCW